MGLLHLFCFSLFLHRFLLNLVTVVHIECDSSYSFLLRISLERTAVTILTSTVTFKIVIFGTNSVFAFRMDHKISINYVLCSKALSMCTGIAGSFLLGNKVILNVLQIRSETGEPLGCMKLKFKYVKFTVHELHGCTVHQ